MSTIENLFIDPIIQTNENFRLHKEGALDTSELTTWGRSITTLLGFLGGYYTEFLINGGAGPLHHYSGGAGAMAAQIPFAIYEEIKYNGLSPQTKAYGVAGATIGFFSLLGNIF